VERQRVIWIGLALGLIMLSSVGVIGYRQSWFLAPPLTVELTAKGPGDVSLRGVAVQVDGKAMGETGTDGVLKFEVVADPGDELALSASLDRAGMDFEPWQGKLVVRKWSRSDPESLRYATTAKLTPRSTSAFVEVRAGGAPVEGASVKVGTKAAGKTDGEGRLALRLDKKLSSAVTLAVQARGFAMRTEKVTLRAGETLRVDLDEQSTVSAAVLAGYESLGRFVPVAEAEARVGDRALGRSDASGRVPVEVDAERVKLELSRDGFLPNPATATLRAESSGSQVVPLYPESGPIYRIVVLPPKNASPDQSGASSARDELEDKLADYLFSFGCFERVDAESFTSALRKSKRTPDAALEKGWAETAAAPLADAVVTSELSLGSELVLSVRVVSVTGKLLGAFAERQKPAKVRQLAESVASEIVEVFPFEGHVVGEDEGGYATTLGGLGRGLRRGQSVEIVRWSGARPPKLKSIARGRIRRFDKESSVIELQSGEPPATGDKVVLLPRAQAATLSASLQLTVLAGTQGSETPFADTNVYRDGIWVGTTRDDGTLEVSVEPNRAHDFLFVRPGVEPHREALKVKRSGEAQTVRVPNTLAHLVIESEPSGARVIVDGREVGTTRFDGYVPLGFRRVQIDGGEGWRAFDQVLELNALEASYTGAQRIVLQKDVLAEAEQLIARGEIDAAVTALSDVGTQHPDYSAAHNLLGGLYLDEKKDPDAAIREFDLVLSLPENRELVSKKFAVTFLNLGRAHYVKGGDDHYRQAIENLTKARDNKRFFPKDQHDRALHDTLYYLALASHRLYHEHSADGALLQQSARRWKDYFDFLPESLQGDPQIQEARESAEQFYAEIRRKTGD
jgi:hypothetical protein